MTDDLDTACHAVVKNPQRRTVDHNAVENRDKCGVCFPDGIPDDVDEVVIGAYSAGVHLPKGKTVDWKTTNPENPRSHSDGLAAKIGAEDFGPEDLGLEPIDGGEA